MLVQSRASMMDEIRSLETTEEVIAYCEQNGITSVVKMYPFGISRMQLTRAVRNYGREEAAALLERMVTTNVVEKASDPWFTGARRYVYRWIAD